MSKGGFNNQGGPRTPEGKAKAMSNLVPGAGRKAALLKSGVFSEEMRERLRPIVYQGANLLQKILNGEPMTPGNPDPTPSEVVGAWKTLAPYVMTELKPVVSEEICRVLAEELANDDRIPFEAIGDVVSNVVARLSNA